MVICMAVGVCGKYGGRPRAVHPLLKHTMKHINKGRLDFICIIDFRLRSLSHKDKEEYEVLLGDAHSSCA